MSLKTYLIMELTTLKVDCLITKTMLMFTRKFIINTGIIIEWLHT